MLLVAGDIDETDRYSLFVSGRWLFVLRTRVHGGANDGVGARVHDLSDGSDERRLKQYMVVLSTLRSDEWRIRLFWWVGRALMIDCPLAII